MLYAVGEIVLVVIGILIALQINNWNENRKDRVEEQKILTSLGQDFDLNIKNLDSTLSLLPEMEERSIRVLSFVGASKDSLEAMDPLSLIRTTYQLTKIVDGTVSSVLSSNKLELIKNDSLKKLLTSYPASTEYFKKREANLEKIIIEIQRPIIENYISLTDLLPNENPLYANIKSNVLKSDYLGLMNDLKWQNVLMNRYYATQELREATMQLKQKSTEIYILL